jgi:hypothetical protein
MENDKTTHSSNSRELKKFVHFSTDVGHDALPKKRTFFKFSKVGSEQGCQIPKNTLNQYFGQFFSEEIIEWYDGIFFGSLPRKKAEESF